jgi:thymidylate synthase (FAD)
MEFVRHRVFSFVQESTRYCNYSKEKFNNELTFIIPRWAETILEGSWNDDLGYDYIYKSNIAGVESMHCNNNEGKFMSVISKSELNYLQLLKDGWVPQEARSVLPNALKTELVMTGTVDQWQGFFKLRCPADAHPQARELAIPLRNEFTKRCW